MAQFALLPFALGNQVTHAPRWAIDESAVGVAHQEVRIAMRDGRRLSAWYVPSRNGAAVLLSHGSGGSRGRVVAHVRMLARHGYGVLALDDPGNGESDGHSNGLGDNAQPAIAAGLDYLAHRPDVNPRRIAGFGLSLGGEVLLEAASRDRRLAAVVSDGATRPMDADEVMHPGPVERAVGWLTTQSVRAISGMKTSQSLLAMMPGSRRGRSCSSPAAASPPRSAPRAATARPAGAPSSSGSCPTPATPRVCARTRPPTSGGRSASWTALWVCARQLALAFAALRSANCIIEGRERAVAGVLVPPHERACSDADRACGATRLSGREGVCALNDAYGRLDRTPPGAGG